MNIKKSSTIVGQPFLDHVQWEEVRQNKAAVRKWIDDNMANKSVVIVCFGLETHTREWVHYEISKAHSDGRGIIAIDMSGMKNSRQETDFSGTNPLSYHKDSRGYLFSQLYPTYSWINDNGYANIESWIGKAATAAGY